MSRHKPYEKGSLMHYADIAFSDIKKLSESALISDKLIGLNTLLFVFVMTLLISFWLNPAKSNIFSLSYFIVLLLSGVFALIASLFYAPILKILANFSKDKVSSLRIGFTILSLILPVAVAGLLFQKVLLLKVSFGLIALQLALVLLSSFVKFSKEPVKDALVNRTEVWQTLNKISIICSILSLLFSILIIVIRV